MRSEVTKRERLRRFGWPAALLTALVLLVDIYDLDVAHEPFPDQCPEADTLSTDTDQARVGVDAFPNLEVCI